MGLFLVVLVGATEAYSGGPNSADVFFFFFFFIIMKNEKKLQEEEKNNHGTNIKLETALPQATMVISPGVQSRKEK